MRRVRAKDSQRNGKRKREREGRNEGKLLKLLLICWLSAILSCPVLAQACHTTGEIAEHQSACKKTRRNLESVLKRQAEKRRIVRTCSCLSNSTNDTDS